jgi:putative transposase
VCVHGADVQDRDGAKLLLANVHDKMPRLVRIWADGGYAGKLVEWVADLGFSLDIVKRSDDLSGFTVLPKRWIVERTFAWLSRYRRLSKDYEFTTQSAEAVIRCCMISLMLKRLA